MEAIEFYRWCIEDQWGGTFESFFFKDKPELQDFYRKAYFRLFGPQLELR